MAISTSLDFTTVLGDLKKTYSEDMRDNRPQFTVLQELLRPEGGTPVGEELRVPVILTHQSGETYKPSGSANLLRAPVSMEIKQAVTDQFEITEIVRLPFGMISKAVQGKEASYADPVRLRVLSGQTSAKRALELSLLHGQNGLGQVASATVVAGTGPFTRDVTFTPQSWSNGIWGGYDNAAVDFWSALTAGTKRNTGDVNVSAVNFATKTVTFTAAASADISGIVANDYVFPATAYSTTQMPGLMNIVSSTAPTLFGISTAYSLWHAKRVDAGAVPLSFSKVTSGMGPAIAAGADGRMVLLVNDATWADLEKDLLTNRRLDQSYTPQQLKNGARSIQYVYSNGVVDVVLHPFMKGGEAVAFQRDSWLRVGSQPDPEMVLAGEQLSVISQVADTIDYRWWCANALIPQSLGTSVYFFNITPST